MGLTPAGSRDIAARLFAPGSPGALALLAASWPRAVGAELAARTEVVGMDRGILRIRVPDARWRKVLHRMQDDIVARLRAAVGPAAPFRLGFVEGPVTPPAAAAPVTAPGATPAASDALQRAADHIPDAALRERFLASAARYLDRFRP